MRDEIPDVFRSLVRSVDKDTYIEAFLAISREYRYNDYFLTKDACVPILSDQNVAHLFKMQQESKETGVELRETRPSRVLNLLVKSMAKKGGDSHGFVTNVVIPDYSAIFIVAFERFFKEDSEETEVFIRSMRHYFPFEMTST